MENPHPVIDEAPQVVYQVRTIFGEVLQLNAIPIDQNFLDLGGDSIMALLCISRIRQQLGLVFEMDDFFLFESTVTEFAAAIHNHRTGGGRNPQFRGPYDG